MNFASIAWTTISKVKTFNRSSNNAIDSTLYSKWSPDLRKILLFSQDGATDTGKATIEDQGQALVLFHQAYSRIHLRFIFVFIFKGQIQCIKHA